jgi:glutamate---cysteine ligase / carboxylate-amine ligase
MRELFTLGVEEEYQLVDPSTLELAGRATEVLAADLSGAVEGEAHETMLEIGTPASRSADEVAEALRQRRFQAGAAAAAEDLEIVAVAAHPFSRHEHAESEAERPRMLRQLFRRIMRQEHISGMHVHVAVPDGIDRALVMDRLRPYSPHLIALSASSPFLLGEDTGFCSFRTISWRRFPFTGVPPRFRSEAEYDAFMGTLIGSGAIPDARTVYWSLRPSPRYPTVELRMCDICPRMEDAVSIAALIRCMVVAAAEDRLEAIGPSLAAPLQDEMLRMNEWIGARDGLHASLIAPGEAGDRLPMTDAVTRLVDAMLPIAESLGDGVAVERVGEILARGNGADRMRELHARTGSLLDVVDWLVQETRAGSGIDRRRESRHGETITSREDPR